MEQKELLRWLREKEKSAEDREAARAAISYIKRLKSDNDRLRIVASLKSLLNPYQGKRLKKTNNT